MDKDKSITTSSLATLLHGVKYRLNEQLEALAIAEDLDEKALIEKAKEIQVAEAHLNACYGIGDVRLVVSTKDW